MILNKELLSQLKEEMSNPPSELVEIKPGVEVKVIQLTAEAGFELITKGEAEKGEGTSAGDGTYRWVCACCVDENNVPVFTKEDLKPLPFDLVQKLAKAVNKANGLTGEGVAEAEKNSEKAGS